MRFEGFFASFSPSFDPVAHRSLAYSQCDGYVFLLPAFLFQLPRSFASFFSPIGFLWCSHTSYSITLYFSLPTSVDIIAEKDLQAFFEVLPTWRDRTLILLMWMSCLRISEVVAIRFEDIEC